MWKNLKLQVLQKIAKVLDVKMLKTIPLPPETMQQPIIKPLRKFSNRWGWKNLNNKKCYKIQKSCNFCQKMLKFVMLKPWKTFHYNKKLWSNLLSIPGRSLRYLLVRTLEEWIPSHEDQSIGANNIWGLALWGVESREPQVSLKQSFMI